RGRDRGTAPAPGGADAVLRRRGRDLAALHDLGPGPLRRGQRAAAAGAGRCRRAGGAVPPPLPARRRRRTARHATEAQNATLTESQRRRPSWMVPVVPLPIWLSVNVAF